jgi:hypothetical protein
VRWVETCGEIRGAYGDLVERPEGKRPLGSHRRRWENNIKMYFQEIR